MPSADIAIVNATVVNEGERSEQDVIISDGRIRAVGSAASFSPKRTIDASGRLLLPGIIDDQVHFREPGSPHKATIADESAAAVAGGVTSFMDMPNTRPPALDQAAVEDKVAIAARTARANYAFYLGASNTNLSAIQSVDPKAICGVKVFMGSSTGNMLVDDTTVLDGIFADAPTLVATHCEDTPMILEAEEQARATWGEDVPFAEHARIRSREACYKSSSLAISLAKKTWDQPPCAPFDHCRGT
jgi:dihydroorotase